MRARNTLSGSVDLSVTVPGALPPATILCPCRARGSKSKTNSNSNGKDQMANGLRFNKSQIIKHLDFAI